MLANVQQATIKPIITDAVVPGTLVHTDEYSIYTCLPAWGYEHKTQMGQNPGHAHAQEQTPLLIVHAKPLMQNAYFQ